MPVHGFRFYFTPLTGVLFTFPSRYLFAIGSRIVFSLGSWSTRILTGFHVPRHTQAPHQEVRPDFAYVALTLSGAPSQEPRLSAVFLVFPGHPRAALQPRFMRFGLLRVRSPLLAESLLISVPVLLRWFTSHSLALPACLLRPRSARLTARGLPHSDIRASADVCSSARLFAACRVLHRHPAPPGIRHGPMLAWPYPCSRPFRQSAGTQPLSPLPSFSLPVKDPAVPGENISRLRQLLWRIGGSNP